MTIEVKPVKGKGAFIYMGTASDEEIKKLKEDLGAGTWVVTDAKPKRDRRISTN
jgi:hypothetical protein